MKISKKVIIFGIAVITILGVIVVWYAIPSVSRGCSLFVGGAGSPSSLYFSETLENGFIEKKGGRPIEGFEPFMFMEVYPGLQLADFNCVGAYEGFYTVENGQVAFSLYRSIRGRQSTAERSVVASGMNRLLQNIADRLGRPFPHSNEEVDDIISMLSVQLVAVVNSTPNQKTQTCPSVPNGSSQKIRETTRLFINIPKDVYPDREQNFLTETIIGNATAGRMPAHDTGEDFESTPECWSYRYDFNGIGEVVLTAKSAMKDVPDYSVRFIVVPAGSVDPMITIFK